ncbi:hypothetical protein OSB04_017016 [Centaurea solstitialis]|uniref:Probable 6-phosphogluconolactonase n=1 Tax=Centaurea solstitialis TaxID=347529 RepID=A0AA38TD52_9ASTR|nr:hypothetical protein OSB04_017016 [Centaurea solstitialis]
MASSSRPLSASLPTTHTHRVIPSSSPSPSSCSPATTRFFRRTSSTHPNNSISVSFTCLKAKASMSANMPPATQEKNVQVFDSEEDLSVALAKYTANLSEKFIKQKGSFTVVVSGGSLIKSLSSSTGCSANNACDCWRFRGRLLNAYPVPIPPGNIYAINDALSAEGAADDYETCVKHLVHNGIISTSEASGFPKFDLMLLGMGPDGHVASLFPGHPLLQEKNKWVAFIKESPKPPPQRITFTFPVINSSANIALVVAGAGKAHPVHVALGHGQDPDLLPVQMVSPEGELAWFLDKDAASKL